MNLKTDLTKEQFIEAIKAAVRKEHADDETFQYHYRLAAASHLAETAREQWDNDAYVNIFMGEPFTRIETEADADNYFGNEYQSLVEAFEDYAEVDESDVGRDTILTPEDFLKDLFEYHIS